MPRTDAGKSAKPKKKYKLPTPKTGGRGDAPQTRKQDFKKAEDHKKTRDYQRSIRTAYRNRSQEDRDARTVQVAERLGTDPDGRAGRRKPGSRRQLSIEDQAVLRTVLRRIRRDREFMQSRGGSDRQTKIIERFKRSPEYLDAIQAVAAREGYRRTKEENKKDGSKQKSVSQRSTFSPVDAAANALIEAEAFGEATYHDPIGVPTKTAKQAVQAIPAIPGGLYDLATDPVDTLKEQGKAFAKRGSQSHAEKVETIRKEGGLEYLGDAAIVLGASGRAAGLTMKVARPRVRISGNTTKAAPKRGAIAGTLGAKMQQRRARKAEQRLQEAEAGGTPIDAVEREAAKANREAGEVVESLGLNATARQGRQVAKERSRGVYGLRHDQGRRTRAANKLLSKLSKKERRAFYYATELGLRTGREVDKDGKLILERLRDLIVETRTRDGVQIKGSLKKSDMLPDIEKILADPDAHFTAKLGETVEALRADSVKAGREDPRLKTATQRLGRRYAPLAEVLGLERGVVHELPPLPTGRPTGPNAALNAGAAVAQAVATAANRVPQARYFDEADAAYVKRVAEHVEELGLARPLYFRSERYAGDPGYGDFAAGGVKAMATDRRWEGVNLRQGLQDTAPRQYVRGLARNIKAKHNWAMVADILDNHGLKEFSRGGGTTVSALRERLVSAGVDLQSVALWNPGAFRGFAHQAGDGPDERHLNVEEFQEAETAAALGHATARIDPKSGRAVDGTGKALPEEMLLKSSGWHVVPAAVLRELEAQMKPSHVSGRIWDVMKGKASRAMLLSGNLPWLGFQVASNVAMSSVATGGRVLNPMNWVGAARWWREMTPEERREAGGLLGLDATGADSHQVRLGASTDKAFVNAYRAFKAHPFWHTGVAAGRGPSISELNPFELMARADRGQNNIIRTVAGYTLAKREAVKRMGESMGRVDAAQARLMAIFSKPPAEQLRLLREDKDLLEEHADAVAEWMGDYTTMTAVERRVVNRAVMFYPFLRYSMRLLFYTMPIKHPLVTAVLAEIGQMKVEELRELFGEDSLPWNSGKIYFGDDGNVRSIDLKKANPALNAPIDALRTGSPGALLGVTPPYVGMLVNQMAGKELFFDRDYRLQGRAAEYGQKLPLGAVEERARIALNDVMGWLYPTRLAGALEYNPVKDGPIPFIDGGTDGRLGMPQGDDSLIFSPRPTRFKGKDSVSALKKSAANKQHRFEEDHESLLRELIPLLPEPNRDAEAAADQALIDKVASKPKSKSKYFGSGGGGSKYFGAE